MDTIALNAAVELSGRGFVDFPAATRGVLELLERQLPGSVVFLGHLDGEEDRFRIVDARGDASFELQPGTSVPMSASFCLYMADDRAPQLCNDAAGDTIYGALAAQRDLDIGSYVGVPLELSSGERIGSLCALSHAADRFTEADLQLLAVMARMLAYELERQERERELRELSEVLRRQASVDPLTGLLNRRALLEGLEREWELTRRDGIPAYLAALDADGLKAVNDARGHAAGDALLQAIADALRETTRRTDIVARVGGDEFAVVLVRAHEEPARFVERLAARLAALAGESATVSVGWTSLAACASPLDALEAADRAMYAVKRARHASANPSRRTR